MMTMSTLVSTNTSWIVIVLDHWNNGPLVDMSLQSDTLFLFRANQSSGADPGVGGHPAPPLKLEEKFFCVKSWFFTRNDPKMFALRSARRHYFKCDPPPPTWNPGSGPGLCFACLAEKQQIQFIYSLVWPSRGSTPDLPHLRGTREPLHYRCSLLRTNAINFDIDRIQMINYNNQRVKY